MKFRWSLIACLLLMSSCGKEIPNDIIQPKKMEKVLYDYHLSMGMPDNNKNTDKEAHKKYIFKKHGITEAEFDSSMVWYTRESNELLTIYSNLDRRFKRELNQMERLLENRDENTARMSLSGDTVDIWRKGRIHWLANVPLKKMITFEIMPDTTFHEKDAFLWDMDYFFFKPGKAIMGMSVIYNNDSVMGKTLDVTESGTYGIYLSPDSAFKVKQIQGFVYVPNDSANQPDVLVHHITLNRYHRLPSDSLSVDDTKVITPQNRKMLKQNQRPQAIDEKEMTRNVLMQEEEPKE